MRKLLFSLAYLMLFLAIDVMVAWHMNADAHTPLEAVRKAETQLVAQLLVRTMKMKLHFPQQVDDITQLDDIRAERGKVIYSLSVDASGAEFNGIMKDLTAHMQETACKREDYRKMLSYGLTVSLSIHAEDGQQAAPINIAPETCGLDKHWLRLAN